jgi:hypothetical protein
MDSHMTSSRPGIALIYSSPYTKDDFSELSKLLEPAASGFRTEEREPSGPQAGLEWLMPTAVIFFIGKAYFDGIFKEMGKDHYGLLKKGVKSLYDQMIGPKAPMVTVLSTAGKTSVHRKYSLLFSLLAEARDGLNFKLLITEGANEVEYQVAVEAFLEFLDAFHRRTLSAELITELNDIRVVGRTLLLAYSVEHGRVTPVDPMG